MCFFSIIVPVYKVQGEIVRCIESLMGQTYNNIEIILVDDGSPDDCPKICDYYAELDDRIKVIHKKNGGLSDARNAGLEIANGEYILFVDSDDYIELDTCEKFAEIVADGQPDIVVGDFIKEYTDGKTIYIHTNLVPGKMYSSQEFMMKSLELNEMRMEICFNIYKRDFWEKHGFRFKIGVYHEDMQITPIIFLKADTVKYMDKPFYHYIVREGSIMQQSNRTKSCKDIMDIYIEWRELSEVIENEDLQKLFRCFLVRCFIHSCADLCIEKPNYNIISKKYILKYSLSAKERLKAYIFVFMPKIYCYVYQSVQR